MADLLPRFPIPSEPKRKNRFIIRFAQDLGIEEYWVVSAKRPSIVQNAVAIPFLNTEHYVVGRYKWEPINITFRDSIGPSTSQALMEWVRLHSESVTGRQGYAAGYKRDLFMEVLDPTGVAVERWRLVGCLVSKADFGDLDYASDDLLTVSMEIQPDYCVLEY